MALVDWGRLGRAAQYWSEQGYRQIEVPWRVEPKYCRITHPEFVASEKLALIGSAEQSFIKLACEGALSPGKFFAISPCFRTEERYDEMRRPEFMKLELFYLRPTPMFEIKHMLREAMTYFRTETVRNRPRIVSTQDGYDIELNGTEIGSYGVRKIDDLCWMYGTGLAEPRFSVAQRSSFH